MPFTLRLVYHSFRAMIRAGLLLLCAWFLLIPANPGEVTALGAADGTQYPTGLRPMRLARVVVAVAPDRTYDAMSFALGTDYPPWLIRLILQQMAQGRVMPADASIPAQPQSDRAIEGPRFIQLD